MDKKINKLNNQDNLTILIFVSVLLVLVLFVMFQVYTIAPDYFTKLAIIITGIVICAFGLSSALAVLMHIKKNKKDIYTAEL
ncbi:hypothetical protein E9840_01390 [Tissierella creatinini]|nr:hypothetical protein E9840_01390 [Tissierella creatinini]TJX64159.1 hypothetical protein E8P77_12960 [Soehngenia saccharolytica]